MKSREALPIERRIKRDFARKRALGAQEFGDRVQLPKKTFDRPLIAPPMVDLNLESSLNRGNGISTLSKRYSLLASGDFLKTNSQLFVSGSDTDSLDTVRLRADRKDPDGYVFGDLGITEFSIGDITTPQLGLVSSSPLGRGVTVSTLPLNQPREFDRTTLTGELPLGWDVELYRNEILIDFKAARDDGRYEFSDVPLLFGVNILKLVFYGPQGQTREEIQQFRVGPDQLKPGELDFLFSANQHNLSLIDRNPVSSDLRRGQERLLAEVQTGVNKNLSLAASVSSIPLTSGERANYGSLSGRFSFAGLFGRVDYVDQIHRGWATKWSAQRQILGISVIGEHSIFSNFESEQIADGDDPLRNSSKLRLDGRIAVPLINQIPVNLTFAHDNRESGDLESSMASRFSGALGRASVTHSSTSKRTVTNGNTVITAEGNLLIGGRIGDLKLRTSTGYQMRPIKRFNTVSLTGDWDIARNIAATAGATRTLSTRVTTYTAGLNYLADLASFGLNLDLTDIRNFGLRLTASFSGGTNPRTGDVAIQAEPMAEKGSLAIKVFEDKNGNGIFDEGEKPLPKISFIVGRSSSERQTNAGGNLLLTGLNPYDYIDVELDRGSLPDPYQIAIPNGIRFVPRPGTVDRYDFGIVVTGEIDGTIYRRFLTEIDPISGANVQLVDKDGKVMRSVSSAYDGFFVFDFVPPGEYVIRVEPEQLREFKLVPANEQRLTIGGEGAIYSGKDITLNPDPNPGAETVKSPLVSDARPVGGAPVDPQPSDRSDSLKPTTAVMAWAPEAPRLETHTAVQSAPLLSLAPLDPPAAVASKNIGRKPDPNPNSQAAIPPLATSALKDGGAPLDPEPGEKSDPAQPGTTVLASAPATNRLEAPTAIQSGPRRTPAPLDPPGEVTRLALYTPNSERRVVVALRLPPGAKLGKGSLDITYTAIKDDGGALLAQQSIPLP